MSEKKEQCGICKFWKYYLTQHYAITENKPEIKIGQCRRYPKAFRTKSWRPNDVYPTEGYTDTYSMPEYPEHSEDDWCGEFKQKHE